MNNKHLKEEQLTLELLDAIEKDSDISQRHLAKKMGIALGLANSYLKRCIKKGLIKIHDAPANRYLYYITPQGFTEKSRLTAQYLSYSFSFYREAGESCKKVYDKAKNNGWNKILLCGISDFAEIASIRAMEMDMDVIGILSPESSENIFIGKPVYKTINSAGAYDVLVITDLDSPKDIYMNLKNEVKEARILVPDILRMESGD
ncbi:MAG: winged helix-turn-helix domain-containing protein [Gammaproteobacteria bacterium]|nr:winged helix-turn-helix domain-containing protein [Gammaproteobacteria bacterium]